MFDLGTQELIVIFIVAFLVFGPKKLPELGRTLGKGIRELKTAMRGVTDSFNEAESDISEGLKQAKDDLDDLGESVYKSIDSNINSKEEKEEDTEGVKDQENSQEKESDSMTAKEENKETDKDG